MTKQETILELVERLDQVYRARKVSLGPTAHSSFDKHWPRISEEIKRLRRIEEEYLKVEMGGGMSRTKCNEPCQYCEAEEKR